MSRRHPKRRMTGKYFAQIPVEVLVSDAVRTLSNSAVRVLLSMAAQYRGNNNGDLALSYAMARPFGVRSKEQLAKSLAMLLERGLLCKTRQGGKKPLGPCLYAVTWQPINDLNGKIDSGPTPSASNAWATWTDSTSAAPEGHSKKTHQHRGRGRSAPPAGQREPLLAPPVGKRGQFIGTTGSTPSRSPREGDVVGVAERGAKANNGTDGQDAAAASRDAPSAGPAPAIGPIHKPSLDELFARVGIRRSKASMPGSPTNAAAVPMNPVDESGRKRCK